MTIKKSLSERIAERVSARKSQSRDSINRATYLALRDDIRGALADGWSINTIWETLREEEKINFGYTAFHRYTHQLIFNFQQQQNTEKHSTTGKPIPEKTSKPKQTNEIKGFNFNPTPNIEELI